MDMHVCTTSITAGHPIVVKIFQEKQNLTTSQWRTRKSLDITKIMRNLLGHFNICSKFHGNPSTSSQNFSPLCWHVVAHIRGSTESVGLMFCMHIKNQFYCAAAEIFFFIQMVVDFGNTFSTINILSVDHLDFFKVFHAGRCDWNVMATHERQAWTICC